MRQHLENEHKEGKITKEELDGKPQFASKTYLDQVQQNFTLISSVHNRELAFYRLATEKFQGLHCPKFIYGEEMTEKQEVWHFWRLDQGIALSMIFHALGNRVFSSLKPKDGVLFCHRARKPHFSRF